MFELIALAGVVYVLYSAFKPQTLTSGIPGGTASPPVPCPVERRDGPFRICLYQDGARWRWRATRDFDVPNPVPTTVTLEETDDTFDSEDEALVAAWIALGRHDIGDNVVDVPFEARGIGLATNGSLSLVSLTTYMTPATLAVARAQEAMEEPGGVVVAVLNAVIGPNVNPLRVRPQHVNANCSATPEQCTLQAAIERVAATEPNPPARARAVFGA